MNAIKIGIVGGGQLGKMMILEGKKLGLHFAILDPSQDCPASSIADVHIVEDFYDREAIRKLAESTDVITYEFEDIDAEILMELEKEGYKVYPSPGTLNIIQNKFNEKTFLKENHIPVGDFKRINRLDELYNISDLYGLPFLLKSCRGGYDGKGNYFIKDRDDIPLAYEKLGGGLADLMAETYIDFKKELSIMAARGMNGEIKTYPLAENIHENNILKTTIVPARVSKEIEKKAEDLAFRTMDVLKGVGIFGIEMFVDQNDQLLVNEIAPRTHNSGHYTIEASSTSQFNQHIRAILGLPLGSTSLIRPALMLNLLGEAGYEGKAMLVGLTEALKTPDVNVHFYGKTITKPERKMGHITILGDSIKEALDKAQDIKGMVKVISSD